MKKKKTNLKLTHYVYYDKKSGKILSVGNEENKQYEHGIQVEFKEIEGFLTGVWDFKDYLVGYKRDTEGNSQLGIVPATDQGYAFKNTVFEWISETDKEVECLVTWHKPSSSWKFSINKSLTHDYESILAPKLVFFITLEHDFDFLVRTIFIDLQDLISSEELSIPFTTNVENKIDKISISSKLVFKTYGLRIIHE